MKKVIILLSLLLLVSCTPQEVPENGSNIVEEETDFTREDDFIYEDAGGYAVICSYIGEDTEIKIPETIDGLTVRGISSLAFYHNLNLYKVTLPDTIESIGESAFADCTRLESINFPEGLKSVGGGIIDNTPLKDSVTEEFYIVGDGILLLCNAKEEKVVLPEGIKFLSDAFSGSDIKSVKLPDSLIAVGDYAFYNSALEEIVFGAKTEAIGNYAFYGCKNLTSADMPDSLTTLGIYAFAKTSLEYLSLPESVTAIPDYAFADAPIKDIVLPDGIIKIGDYAFRGCLETSLMLPEGLESIGRGMIENSENIKTVFFPSSITYIGEGAFRGCPNLVIYGNEDSLAMTYANENGIPFARIG